MTVRAEDVRQSKLKFMDAQKSVVNVKDSTNNLIFAYQAKKLRKFAAAVVKTESTVPKVTNSFTLQIVEIK